MHINYTMPDEEAILNRYYFPTTASRTDEDIIKDHVIFTKDKLSEIVSMEYDIHYELSQNLWN